MAVTGTSVVTTRGLNRISELDPLERVSFTGVATGDASGGNAEVTTLFNQNRAFLIMWAVAVKISVAAVESALFRITSVLDAVTAAPELRHCVDCPVNVGAVDSPVFVPPPILFLGAPGSANLSAIILRMDNSGVGDDVTLFGEALLFDLITARNMPGAQYWPYRQL